MKKYSKWFAKCEGLLPAQLSLVIEFVLPARRIGQRWRATRAPMPVHIRMGRALCSALSAAHPVCRKAINSSFALEGVGPLGGRHCHHPGALTPVCFISSFSQALLHALDLSFQSGRIKRRIFGPQLFFRARVKSCGNSLAHPRWSSLHSFVSGSDSDRVRFVL